LLVAVDAHRRLGATPWVALSLHALAGVLRARGDGDRAVSPADEADRLGRSLGLRPLGGVLPWEG
jgi:hypothetical protein